MSNFIKNWTEREVELLAKRVRRYSALVSGLKFVLPIAAVVIIGWLIFESKFSGGKKIFIAPPEKVEKLPEKPIMTNLKYNGMDSGGQPYSLLAKEAVQQSAEQTDLKDITADITMKGGTWVSIVAGQGSYFNKTRQVKLVGEVSVFITPKDGTAHQIVMNGAEADMQTGILKSTGGVAASGDYGTLQAGAMVLEREKSKISFTQRVKLVIIRK